MYLILFLAAVIALAGGSPVTLAVATTIALVFAAVSPAALRYVKLDGPTMAAVSYLVALAIALGAGLLTGELSFSRDSAVVVLLGSGATWSVQQAVYKILWPAAGVMAARLVSRPPATTYRHS